jgi:C4-type Zn-finger protein
VDEITTVDGLLEKYIDHLEPLCGETENPERCREVVEWMKRAMKGEERFTLIIEDPSGRSRELDIKM